MQSPADIDLFADRRVPFLRMVGFVGYDFAGSDYFMQVRPTRDTTTTPLVSLSKVTTDTQGLFLFYSGNDTLQNHLSQGRIDQVPPGGNPYTGLAYNALDAIDLSILQIRIADPSFGGILPAVRGNDLELFYDLIVDTPTLAPDVYMRGKFIVRAGVTTLS